MPAVRSNAPRETLEPKTIEPMGTLTTPQASFWQGEFGDSYTDRNVASPEQLQARRAMWAGILSHTLPAPPKSILEVGANLGINLRSLRALTSARFLALEPNERHDSSWSTMGSSKPTM